ncbi:MAG TPA: hypothetical protein VFU78_09750 [Thermomicrobiales bacterium]|nr:hypothetical protein [Thermomicrobiales bacterium]
MSEATTNSADPTLRDLQTVPADAQDDDGLISKMMDEVKERHLIFALLLMALVEDQWDENTRDKPGGGREFVQGQNIGAIAVDPFGRVIDFDFNHNLLFNSSLEHAEARLLRRLFTLTLYDDVKRPVSAAGLSPQAVADWVRQELWLGIDQPEAVGAFRRVDDAPAGPPPLPNDFGMQDTPSTVHRDLIYTKVLPGFTIYTSLEPCAQCSGMMALGRVQRVVYLQRDPKVAAVANILYNLYNPPGADPSQLKSAPLPIQGSLFGLDYTTPAGEHLHLDYAETLNDAFEVYRAGTAQWSASDFLTRDDTRAIFQAATGYFEQFGSAACDPKAPDGLPLRFPDYKPPWLVASAKDSPRILTNNECLRYATYFRWYARTHGYRGTPHGR